MLRSLRVLLALLAVPAAAQPLPEGGALEGERYRVLVWGSITDVAQAVHDDPAIKDKIRVWGYFDANLEGVLEQGAHDFRRIHTFFRDTGLTLAGFRPDDTRCGGDPYRWTCAFQDHTASVYLANPSGGDPGTDVPGTAPPEVTLTLPAGTHIARWFDPSTGAWFEGGSLSGGPQTLTAPDLSPNHSEDWILLVQPSLSSRG